MSGTVDPQDPMPEVTENPPPDPKLIPGTDPVLLARLYPGATSGDSAKTDAMAAGDAAKELGATIQAAQQDPDGTGGKPPAEPPAEPPPAEPPPETPA